MGRLIMLILIVLVLLGCTPDNPRHKFGDSRKIFNDQIIDLEAGKNLDPIIGMQGESTAAAYESYLSGFCEQSTPRSSKEPSYKTPTKNQQKETEESSKVRQYTDLSEDAEEGEETPQDLQPQTGPGYTEGYTIPQTGEFLAPDGAGGYVGTRDGTHYSPSGPGHVNDKTGEWIPY